MKQVSIKNFFVTNTRVETQSTPKSTITSTSALSSTSTKKTYELDISIYHINNLSIQNIDLWQMGSEPLLPQRRGHSDLSTILDGTARLSMRTRREKKNQLARRKELTGQWTEEKKQEEKDK
ncbi:hypothetical protein BHYA_0076g00100 [Botrytis hyacinthi]|uniref:Uncharacterized protein n=1 Tax=Botrytis hyacinthi TaxID=278943 RepID=A0A4Z1GS07_9HELO|nr:hypothetical protein BHYA_0076g00100 [Botrytis hyacinthi]